jgi:23S rRNA (cytidine1920-2'-O)/16S rRNA (cytidine1409-2'-O)-methyltransferase
VRRGLCASRTEAQAAIDAGRVLVAGAPAAAAARLVSPSEPILLTGPPPRFVGRGGEKLAGALDRFGIDVAGLRCLDAGASTGGFTDCLLQRGAAHVVAVDVGHGQLHERLRRDERVTVLDRTNVRHLTADAIGGRVEFVTADLSFISLTTVMPALLGELATPAAAGVFLVKPQFEAGRAEAAKGKGVIRDPAVWERVLVEVASSIARHGAVMIDVMVSPLLGADGNVEFLAHVTRAIGDAEAPAGVGPAAIATAVAEARGRTGA